MHVFIGKSYADGKLLPAGEMEQVGSHVKLHYNDYLLMRILKAVFSRSICRKSTQDGKTTKCICPNKFETALRFVKRPYFFMDNAHAVWKFTEVMPT